MPTIHTRKVRILGITCEACTKLINKRISNIQGIENVNINDSTGITEIVSTENFSLNQIEEALNGTEYKVVTI